MSSHEIMVQLGTLFRNSLGFTSTCGVSLYTLKMVPSVQKAVPFKEH
jgi:hypothetical protein